MNPAVTQSLLMAKHLRSRDAENQAWVQALDRYFLSAAFEDRPLDPFFTGPDNLTYYTFRSARSYDVEFMDFTAALNHAVRWAAGGVVYPGGGLPEWIYSPGDMVSLSLWRTSRFQWSGDWALEPIFADYAGNKSVNVGKPSPEVLPPMAARSLEYILRRIYRSEPALSGRAPGVALLRPESRTRPEQASELIVNAFREDFSNSNRAEGFPHLVRSFLPSHLGRRLVSFESRLIPEDQFTSLGDLIADGGLDAVPQGNTPPAGG